MHLLTQVWLPSAMDLTASIGHTEWHFEIADMDSLFIKAQHYHDQAQKMRDLAGAEEDQASRTALLEIAEGYERLCQKFLRMGQEAVKRKS